MWCAKMNWVGSVTFENVGLPCLVHYFVLPDHFRFHRFPLLDFQLQIQVLAVPMPYYQRWLLELRQGCFLDRVLHKNNTLYTLQ
jgi:hypothetical protein